MSGRSLLSFVPTETEWIAGSLSLVLTLFSGTCTVINLWLIKHLDSKSGYTRLIQALTSMQLVYDVGLLLVTTYWIDPLHRLSEFLTAFGGIGTSLWSNAISFVVVYIVVTKKTFNIEKHFKAMAIGITVFGLIFGIGCASTVYDAENPLMDESKTSLAFSQAYYWARFASIVANIIAWAVVSRKLHLMGFKNSAAATNGRTRSVVHPVTVLAGRLKWYPIVQTISRAGASWYELVYGFETQGYSDGGPTHVAALVCYAVLTPLAGIGFFAIFLLMQRDGYELLVEKLKEWCACCTCCFPGNGVSLSGGKTDMRGSLDSVSSEVGARISNYGGNGGTGLRGSSMKRIDEWRGGTSETHTGMYRSFSGRGGGDNLPDIRDLCHDDNDTSSTSAATTATPKSHTIGSKMGGTSSVSDSEIRSSENSNTKPMRGSVGSTTDYMSGRESAATSSYGLALSLSESSVSGRGSNISKGSGNNNNLSPLHVNSADLGLRESLGGGKDIYGNDRIDSGGRGDSSMAYYHNMTDSELIEAIDAGQYGDA